MAWSATNASSSSTQAREPRASRKRSTSSRPSTVSTDYINFDGKFWNLDHKRIQVRPYQEFPQFALAGMSGVHNFDLCGSRGYSTLSIYFTPVRIESNPGMPDLRSQGAALAEAAQRSGRDPERARQDWRICREVYVSDSKDAAMSEIRESLRQSYDYLFKIGLAPLMKRGTRTCPMPMSPSTGWSRTFPGSSAHRPEVQSPDPRHVRRCRRLRDAPLQLPGVGHQRPVEPVPSSCLPATSPRTSADETTNASGPNWPTTLWAGVDLNTMNPPHPAESR